MPKGFLARLRWISIPKATTTSDVEKQEGSASTRSRSAVGHNDIPVTPTRRISYEWHSIPRTNSQISLPGPGKVNIRVGKGENTKTFSINKTLLCEASGLLNLGEHDPAAFDLLLQWLHNPTSPINYNPDGQSQEPWLSHSAEAWILGEKMQTDEDFKKYALSQFIQTCALIPFGPWEMIEREAPSRSPLRRFSDHWVAWNCRLFGPGQNEFSHLLAACREPLVPEIARDPRIYDIEHWYSECGDVFNPGCEHDPVTRQEKIEEANRPPLAPLVEWGRSFEAQRTGLPLAPGTVTVSPSKQRLCKMSSWSNFWYWGGGIGSNMKLAICSGIFFGGQVFVTLVLAVLMLKESDDGVRFTTRTYTLFVACLYGVNFIIPIIFPVHCFFAFAAGCAIAVDLKTCKSYASAESGYVDYYNTGSYYGIGNSCKSIEALTVLVWLSIPMSGLWCGALAIIFD